jgi:hypothetical protein
MAVASLASRHQDLDTVNGRRRDEKWHRETEAKCSLSSRPEDPPYSAPSTIGAFSSFPSAAASTKLTTRQFRCVDDMYEDIRAAYGRRVKTHRASAGCSGSPPGVSREDTARHSSREFTTMTSRLRLLARRDGEFLADRLGLSSGWIWFAAGEIRGDG